MPAAQRPASGLITQQRCPASPTGCSLAFNCPAGCPSQRRHSSRRAASSWPSSRPPHRASPPAAERTHACSCCRNPCFQACMQVRPRRPPPVPLPSPLPLPRTHAVCCPPLQCVRVAHLATHARMPPVYSSPLRRGPPSLWSLALPPKPYLPSLSPPRPHRSAGVACRRARARLPCAPSPLLRLPPPATLRASARPATHHMQATATRGWGDGGGSPGLSRGPCNERPQGRRGE